MLLYGRTSTCTVHALEMLPSPCLIAASLAITSASQCTVGTCSLLPSFPFRQVKLKMEYMEECCRKHKRGEPDVSRSTFSFAFGHV